MEGFKHLKKKGTEYEVKQYIALQHIIGIAWVCISILLIENNQKLNRDLDDLEREAGCILDRYNSFVD
ncbi:hypothetical protein [Chryseobacterium sp. KCF3-3]|uniref:hypothetical protein n=1 Tax=Chryseobacterium sp. KCF3-3 TaxID=3231511 RepID=UPI0005521CD5